MNIVAHTFSRIFSCLIVLAISLVMTNVSTAWSAPSSSVDAKDAEDAEPVAESPPKPPEKIEVVVAVNVPVNANAHDEFGIFPYPVPPPPVTDFDFELPSKESDLREFLKEAVLNKWGQPGNPTPDWRVDRALQLALRHSRKHLPGPGTELNPWLDEFLPYFRTEILVINAQGAERRKRFDVCGSHEAGRRAFQEDAAVRGLGPVNLRVRALKHGLRQDKGYVVPSNWWIVGVHSTPGMLYYWQEKRVITEGLPRLIDLNEKNATLIRGHY